MEVVFHLCKDCGQSLPVTEFYRSHGGPGLYPRCKKCECVRLRARHAANPGRERKRDRARDRARYWGDVEKFREKRRERAKRKYWADHEASLARERIRRQDPIRKRSRQEAGERRRARKAQVPHTLTRAEWGEILAQHGNRCSYCGVGFSESLQPTMDHVVPICRGGGHTKENLVPACRPCNTRKGIRDWLPGYGPFIPQQSDPERRLDLEIERDLPDVS